MFDEELAAPILEEPEEPVETESESEELEDPVETETDLEEPEES
jgi:hypothetical protein